MTTTSKKPLAQKSFSACTSSTASDLPWTSPASVNPEALVQDLRELKLQKKQLETREKDLLARISDAYGEGLLDQWEDAEPDTFVFAGISLKRSERTTFTYSAALKGLQKAEQANGTAEKKVSNYWTTKIES